MFLSQNRINKKIRKFHIKLISMRLISAQSFNSNSKLIFSDIFDRNYDVRTENTAKMHLLDSNRLAARILFKVFIAH